ncbi:MAG: LuxR C-terminal-related transcriptional regulator [Actinomycetota bacterium]|nr:LuxR C-terminal-related transcriptional regulator [Actinomycetota bacterium]
MGGWGVDGGIGAVVLSSTDAGASSPTWSTDNISSRDSYAPYRMSCASTTLCVAADNNGFKQGSIATSGNPATTTPTDWNGFYVDGVNAHRVPAGAAYPAAILVEFVPRSTQPRDLVALGLTSRQGEILLLAKTGSTNAEIARQLSVSPRTVAHHLAHIYSRLGVSNRTAAINRVDRHLACVSWEPLEAIGCHASTR